MRGTLPATLQPAQVSVIVDSREQTPWDLSPLAMQSGTLTIGDYALAAMPTEAVIERKSLPDFLHCCGTDRERYEKQLARLRGVRHKLVVVEASWAMIEAGQWRSKLRPESVTGSVMGWMSEGIPFVFAGDHKRAAVLARRFLFIIARRRWRELRQLSKSITSQTEISS